MGKKRNRGAETGVAGGSIGIRTLETVPRLHTFQACAFDHSATDPLRGVIGTGRRGARGDSGKPALIIGQLHQSQADPAVLPPLLFNLANFHPTYFTRPRHMGAATGLQINLVHPLPDADQPYLALPHRRHH